MNTMAGVVAVDRFVFGEIDSLSVFCPIQQLGSHSPAERHLRQLCASCHLGNEKTIPSPPNERSRGGGCIACHLDYSKKQEGQQHFHPAINLRVTNDHCFGCHSRSGRIATNYEGWHETTLTASEVANQPGYRMLADGRVFQSMPPDIHHQAGLECIDCHGANDLMGDWNQYQHEEEAVRARCQDCHWNQKPALVGFDKLDIESQKILLLRKADYLGADFVVSPETGTPLLNVILDAHGQPQMIAKNNGQRHKLTPPAEACTRGAAHDALSCNACHTAWAPQCIGCHNTFEPETLAFDQLTKQKTKGKWIEEIGGFFAEPPTLGVMQTKRKRQIQPFVPGMIMSIDKTGLPGSPYGASIFHRLFAPAAPHTTMAKGRSCTSCHNDPLALGYGRGEMRYTIQAGKGHWTFLPDYKEIPLDGLPQDAWIDFLQFPAKLAATRQNARPFNRIEQQKILTVGACLTCHKGDSKVMQKSLDDFQGTVNKRRKACILPEW